MVFHRCRFGDSLLVSYVGVGVGVGDAGLTVNSNRIGLACLIALERVQATNDPCGVELASVQPEMLNAPSNSHGSSNSSHKGRFSLRQVTLDYRP